MRLKALLAGIVRTALTIAGFLLLVAVGVVAYYMLVPVDFSGLGIFGLLSLAFPLHLLAVTLLAAALSALAWRCGAWLGRAVFGIAAALTAVMALWPCLVLWQRARNVDVVLSLGEYVTNALRPNSGGPDAARSVVYGTAPDGSKLELDVWRTPGSDSGRPHPAFVRIHGGGWVQGRRGEFGAWNRWLNDLGYDVFDVEYRLNAPEPWRDEVGDVKCALGWVAAHAAAYGIDPSRIGTMGYSAGGQLAMLAAFTPGDPELPPSCDAPIVPVKLVVNLYGPTDLLRGYDEGGSLAYGQDALRKYIGGTPAEYPDRYRTASPINHVGSSTPPTITLLGESDRIITTDQAQMLDAALAGAGVPHETYLLPATDHAFDLNWGGFATQIARAKIRQFLLRYD